MALWFCVVYMSLNGVPLQAAVRHRPLGMAAPGQIQGIVVTPATWAGWSRHYGSSASPYRVRTPAAARAAGVRPAGGQAGF